MFVLRLIATNTLDLAVRVRPQGAQGHPWGGGGGGGQIYETIPKLVRREHASARISMFDVGNIKWRA